MTDTSTSASRRPRRAGPALALLAFAQFIIAADYNIVYVALPEIGRELDFSGQTLQWVVSAYAVAFGGFMLLGGRAADLLGRRRVFVLALVLYAVSSLAGGLAESPGPLIGVRAAQGLGAALLFPATLSLIGTTFAEGPERNRALAVWAAMGGGGLAGGALLGGVLTDLFGWESVFHVFVLLAGAALLAAFPLLPADRPSGAGPDAAARERRFDLPGALTATAGITLLVLVLAQGPEWGWTSSPVLAALGLGLALLVVFAVIESRSRDPLMPPRMFANPSLVAAMAITAVFGAGLGAQYYLLTVYLQDVLGYDPLRTGLAYLPLTLLNIVGTKVAERLITRAGMRAALSTGLVTGTAGMVLLALTLSPHAPFAAVLPGVMVTGFGMGVVWTSMWIAAGNGVAAGEQGVASGMASVTHQSGLAAGTALMVFVANAGTGGLDGDALRRELTRGLSASYYLAAGVTVLGVLVTGAALGRRHSPRTLLGGRGEQTPRQCPLRRGHHREQVRATGQPDQHHDDGQRHHQR
ncbi:MFS transporter [Streptosporangium sp. NBC_01495]|uniref:MFS transporter n=1 Tax=Streptosporangium sp. NBC_01495 TaxID=2903899 RepID=UPI002E318C0D|nr:MFS transporter [Streptosporangium sp. NBC_01495]